MPRQNCGRSVSGSLDWLPKVISEMVGQTCRFAAAPSRAPPTISEMTFGNHSSSTGFGARQGAAAPLMLQTCMIEQPKSKHLRGDSRSVAGTWFGTAAGDRLFASHLAVTITVKQPRRAHPAAVCGNVEANWNVHPIEMGPEIGHSALFRLSQHSDGGAALELIQVRPVAKAQTRPPQRQPVDMV